MRISVFTTGGTIDKTYFDAKSDYRIGDPAVGAILSDACVAFEFDVTELLRKDSLEFTDADRAQVRAAVESAASSHILITHGTDTMPETGRALLGIPRKVIVLTGALSPARFQHSDAPFNIGCAIGALQSLTPGVYIAMNGRVFPADNVRKNRAEHRFEALDGK